MAGVHPGLDEARNQEGKEVAMAKNVPAVQKKTAVGKPGSWEEQMAAVAQQGAEAEALTGASRMISFRGAVMTYAGTPIKDNKQDSIILDNIFENAFYGNTAYDPDEKKPPVCFAYSDDGKDMAPHEKSTEPQSEKCEGCKWNEFKTAKKQDGSPGKGKACKNTRRLLIIPASALENGADGVKKADYGIAKLPVTSTIAWANYVKSLNASYKRPPFGVVTEVACRPHQDNVVQVTFEAQEPIKDAKVGAAIIERRAELHDVLRQPYEAKEEDDAKPTKSAKKKGKF